MENLVVVIMCGGSGSRLWPLSRTLHPKQFLNLTDKKLSMFQISCKHAISMNPSKIIVVCNIKHNFLIQNQMTELNFDNYTIISEPFGRDTSAAIASASLVCNKDDNILILTADHFWDENKLNNIIIEGINIIKNSKSIVFVGIKPTHPETGYGYIKYENDDVIEFVEKPNLEKAIKYLESTNYLWNSGIFLFNNDLIQNEFQTHAKDIFNSVKITLDKSTVTNKQIILNPSYFEKIRSKSIDYTVMEKHTNGKVIKYDGYWRDIGSFKSLYEHMEKNTDNNVITGDIKTINTKNCLINSDNRLITTIGINNIIIMDTPDALLVADMEESQTVKDLVGILESENHHEIISHTKVYRPWGWYINIDGDDYSGSKIKRICVYPGKRLSLQSHYHRSEHWVITKGQAKVQIGKDFLILGPNQHIYIPKETLHRMENIGDELVEFVETQIGDYLGEDDIVRYEDDFGRV